MQCEMPPAARISDQVTAPPHGHGCPACPHPHVGQIFLGAATVLIENKPAARKGDNGTAAACCGPNTFQIVKGSTTVLIEGKPAARVDDQTLHCGIAPGKIVSGAGTVIIGG